MTTAAVTSEMRNDVNQMHVTPVLLGKAAAIVPKKKRFVGCAEIRKWLGKDKPVVLKYEDQDPDPVATLRKQKLTAMLHKPKKGNNMFVVRTRSETLKLIHSALNTSTTLSSALYGLQQIVTARYAEKTLNGKFHQNHGGVMDCSALVVGATETPEMVLLLTRLGVIKVECTVAAKKGHKNRYNVICYDNTLIDHVTDVLGLEERSRFSIKTIEQLREVYNSLAPTEADFEHMPDLKQVDMTQPEAKAKHSPIEPIDLNDVSDLRTMPFNMRHPLSEHSDPSRLEMFVDRGSHEDIDVISQAVILKHETDHPRGTVADISNPDVFKEPVRRGYSELPRDVNGNVADVVLHDELFAGSRNGNVV